MNSIGANSNFGAPAGTLLKLWAPIVAAFIVATAVQILFYGAPTLCGFGAYHVSSVWYTPVVLAWVFAPASLALVFSLRRLAAFRRRWTITRSAATFVFVMLLDLMSTYMGVFVAFNMWGT